MNKLLSITLHSSLLLLTSSLSAAVPLRWTVETNRIQPAQFEAYHGEALEFEATFNSLGKPLALDSHTATLYYQTNGMDQAWWSFPASVSGNVARAVFTPAMDPAAKQITVFLGVSAGPSNQNYRASASVRFWNSPGAAPGWIEPPVVKLDFSTIETLNAPWFTKDESNDRFPVKSAVYTKTETDAALSDKQDVIADLNTIRSGAALGATAVQPSAIGDMETKTHAAATYQPKGSYLTSESDPTVCPWAKATTKPSYSWSEIGSKPTFAAVATSGAYSDLTGKPSIPTDSTVAGWGYIKSWTETDPTVPSWAKATSKPSYTWNEIGSKPTFAAVATSGAYSDLTGKPSIPTDSTVAGWGYIKSWTETDPSVDGKISDHNSNHDAHDDIRDELWNIHQDISAKADNDMVNAEFENIYANFPDRVEMDDSIDDKISAHNTSTNAHTDIRAALSDKQDVIADLNTIRSGAALGATALQSYTETDPTISAWAKATSKPTYTWTEISSKPSWIGSSKPSYTWTEISSKPTTFTPSAHSHASDSWFTGALSGKIDKEYQGASSHKGTIIYMDDDYPTIEFSNFCVWANNPKAASDRDNGDFQASNGFSVGAETCYRAGEIYHQGHTINIQAKDGTLALTSDIPTTMAWGSITGKPSWIGASKPSYTWTEIGSKPTFAAVATSGAYSDLTDKPTIPTDSTVAGWGYIKSWTETDPTVPSWAKATSKPTYTWTEISNKPSWIGSSKPSYTWTEIGSKPTTFAPSAHTHAQSDVTGLSAALDGKLDKVGDADYGTKVFWDSDGMTLKVKGNMRVNPDGDFAGLYVPQAQNVDDDEVWNIGQIRGEFEGYSWDWSAINNTPTTLAGYGIEDASISGNTITLGSHSATIPTALKCPNSLTIQLNGTTAATYDGSAARTVNITTGGAPGATVASAALEYHADGQAISVSVAAAGTLTAVVNNWTDGQSQMAFVTLAAGASIAPAIKLIGYSEWPIGEEFMAVCTKRGSKIYVNPVCITEE